MSVGINDARAMVEEYMQANIPCFLWGAPGVGKSDVTRQIAKDKGCAIIDYRAILRDPVDFRGLPSVEKDAEGNACARWLPPNDLPNEARDGKEGILFLDELNAASQAVQAACFGLVLDRKLGEYTLPPGWRIVAAGNRQSHKAAANRIPTALANRFAHIDVVHSVDDFASWASQNDVAPEVIAFVRFRPALLHDMKPSESDPELRAFPTPRAWAQVSKIVHTKQNQKLRFQMIKGIVGEGAAGEFEAFLRVYMNLPSLDMVLTSPMQAPIPDEVSAKYAIASGLARKMTTKNMANAITYMERVGKEFSTLSVLEAAKRDNALTHCKAFTDWSVKHADMVENM